MRCRIKKTIAVCLFTLVLSMNANAQLKEVPYTDGILYYQIGGGRHITIPPRMTITTINLSANLSMAALTCGNFDLGASIEASLDQLSQGVDNAVNAIEAAASSAIANLPGYILQKANPGLYDLFQNALLRAQESFALATKSCERMQYEISQNINPYSEWVTLSQGDSWKKSIGYGEENIHEAKEEANDAQENGVKWIGGISKGGRDQEPIRILSEVAAAGLNILSDRHAETMADLPSDAMLRQHFSGPDAVKEWVIKVLGDLEISVCRGCSKGAIPGRGLIPYIESEADGIADHLTAVVVGDTRPTRNNLEVLSAPGIAITNQVVDAIRNLTSVERGIVTNKLAQEIAEARIMEEAMVVRRLLLSGKKDGDVSAVSMAVEEVEKALEELEKEIKNVIFEKRIRGSMVSNTVIEVLKHDNAKRQAARSLPVTPLKDDNPLDGGAVSR